MKTYFIIKGNWGLDKLRLIEKKIKRETDDILLTKKEKQNSPEIFILFIF